MSVKTTIATGVIQALENAVSGIDKLAELDEDVLAEEFIDDIIEMIDSIQEAIVYWQSTPTPNMEAPMEDEQ